MKKFLALFILLVLVSACGSSSDDGGDDSPTKEGDTILPVADPNTSYVERLSTISNHTVDLCTEKAGESCYFAGGQLIKFSDGRYWLSGGFNQLFGTDVDSVYVPVITTATATFVWVRLSIYVARGSGYQSLYLTYDVNEDKVALILDTDKDNIPEKDTDETLVVPSVTVQ